MARPVAVRQPSTRWGRSWILRSSRRSLRSRSSGVSKAMLAIALRTSDQTASTGFRSGEYDGRRMVVSQSCSASYRFSPAAGWVLRHSAARRRADRHLGGCRGPVPAPAYTRDGRDVRRAPAGGDRCPRRGVTGRTGRDHPRAVGRPRRARAGTAGPAEAGPCVVAHRTGGARPARGAGQFRPDGTGVRPGTSVRRAAGTTPVRDGGRGRRGAGGAGGAAGTRSGALRLPRHERRLIRRAPRLGLDRTMPLGHCGGRPPRFAPLLVRGRFRPGRTSPQGRRLLRHGERLFSPLL